MKNSLRSLTLRRDPPGAREVPPGIAKQNVSEIINEEEYLSIRASILALIKRAGLTGDSLEHSHLAVLAAVDLQWSLRTEMGRLLNEAKAAGDRLRDPSLVLAPQVANHIRRELNKLTFSTWISPYIEPILKSCCYVVTCCTIVYVTHTLSQRDRPEVDELIAAAGQNLNGWAKFENQNDLFGMLRTCQKYPSSGVDPQGRRYCSVLVIMNNVLAPHDGSSLGQQSAGRTEPMKSETTVDPALDQCLDDDHIAQHMPGDVQRTAALSNMGESSHHADDIDPRHVASHPGLLALARVLGRSAARADLRRARRGAAAIIGMADAVLVVAAMITGALVWSVIMRLF